MEFNVKDLNTDFDIVNENNAEKIASLVRTLSVRNSEYRGKHKNLHEQEKRTKTSFTKRILCCLKLS